MFVHVDPTHDLAIYDQIVRQIKFAVANGAVGVGELVPSVREMARELAINPNTVARAICSCKRRTCWKRCAAKEWPSPPGPTNAVARSGEN